MPIFSYDGIQFNYRSAGEGTPFILQHGLGGDGQQPFGLFQPPPGFRLLCLDCRAHGETGVGDPRKINFRTFAEDLLAWMDHLGLARPIIGGISMGAALALIFTLRFPTRVRALVLSRCAWLEGPNLWNQKVFNEIALLLRQHGPGEGAEIFRTTPTYRQTLALAPDTAASLLAQFESPHAVERMLRLERIPADAPCDNLGQLRSIQAPTLILANRPDPIHPFEFGEALARAIPNAQFQEITAKSVDSEKHAADFQRTLTRFLQEIGPDSPQPPGDAPEVLLHNHHAGQPSASVSPASKTQPV